MYVNVISGLCSEGQALGLCPQRPSSNIVKDAPGDVGPVGNNVSVLLHLLSVHC